LIITFAKNNELCIHNFKNESRTKQNILDKIENNKDLINGIITTTLKNSNCKTIISLSSNELKIKDCDIYLAMFSEIYF
jgi:hypothetical protein